MTTCDVHDICRSHIRVASHCACALPNHPAGQTMDARLECVVGELGESQSPPPHPEDCGMIGPMCAR